MGFTDYLWLIRLIIEILKMVADMDKEEVAKLKQVREIMQG